MDEIKRTKFNVSILGESTVGKTSMCSVFLGKEFSDNTLLTIGIESDYVVAKFEGKEYKFKIFDTAGQERYRSIAKHTINLADGFLLVYAVDDKKTFETLGYWIKSIEEKCDISRKVLILVGNKIDIENRTVKKEEALSFAKTNNIKYFETSAKSGDGIKEIFNLLFEEVYKKSKEIENLDKAENEQNNSNENKNPAVKLEQKETDKKNRKTKEKKGGFC
jgi:small GTP-binding protein